MCIPKVSWISLEGPFETKVVGGLGSENLVGFNFWLLFVTKNCIWRWLFHQLPVDTKKWFFRPPTMSFGFLDVIFGEKGLEIDTYKHPKFVWSYHTHIVNTTCWPYVCDMTKYILEACNYVSQVPFPQISRQEIQNSSWGVEKTTFNFEIFYARSS